MGVLIDVCTTAIKSVYSLPVVLAGVHTLHTLVVSCWPRFTTLVTGFPSAHTGKYFQRNRASYVSICEQALQSRVLNALRAAAEAAPRLCTEGETDGPDWCAAVLATAEMVQKLLSSLITVPAIQ